MQEKETPDVENVGPPENLVLKTDCLKVNFDLDISTLWSLVWPYFWIVLWFSLSCTLHGTCLELLDGLTVVYLVLTGVQTSTDVKCLATCVHVCWVTAGAVPDFCFLNLLEPDLRMWIRYELDLLFFCRGSELWCLVYPRISVIIRPIISSHLLIFADNIRSYVRSFWLVVSVLWPKVRAISYHCITNHRVLIS